MGTRHLVYYKKEFENSWPIILDEKLEGLASVDIIAEDQDEYIITYGSSIHIAKNLSYRPAPSIVTCVKYSDGFFWIVGTSAYGGIIVITANKTCNMNKHQIIFAKITAILDEMAIAVPANSDTTTLTCSR